MTISKSKQTALKIIEIAVANDIQVTVRGTILTLEKSFTPEDLSAYMSTENAANHIFSLAPMTTPGSVWGSDSGSIGGAIACQNGYFKLNKSGVSKRILNALKKEGC